MSKSFMEQHKAKRDARRAKNKLALFGLPADEAPDARPPSQALYDALTEAGVSWDGFGWTIARPEGAREVSMEDLAAYCDSLTIEQFNASCRLPADFTTDDPGVEAMKLLEPLAAAAASKGFGTIYVPFGVDGNPEPVVPIKTFKYDAIGEKIGKDVGKKYETLGAKVGKRYAEAGDKFKKFGTPLPAAPGIPEPEVQGAAVDRVAVQVIKEGAPVVTKQCRACGGSFTTAFHQVIYCSEACRKRALRAPTGQRSDTLPGKRACEVCGKELPLMSSAMCRFCSDTCHDVYFSTHVRMARIVPPSPRVCQGCNTHLSYATSGRCPVCGAKLS